MNSSFSVSTVKTSPYSFEYQYSKVFPRDLCENESSFGAGELPGDLKVLDGQRVAVVRLKINEMLAQQILGHLSALVVGVFGADLNRVALGMLRDVRLQLLVAGSIDDARIFC